MNKQKKIAKKSKKKNKLITPLKPGDIIDIIAPGSPADFEILNKAAAVLESWGYKARFSKDLLKPGLMYLANTDAYRFQSLKKALLAKDSKAVWCLRGGYGCIRLMPFISKLKKPKHQKLFIGLSDITSLHIFLNQKWNWPTVHGPLVDRIGQGLLPEDNVVEVKALLEGSKKQFVFSSIKPMNVFAEKIKNIKGPVIGGNLMVATSSLGTDHQISASGKILFLEEISERAYRFDRCLQQMKQAGVFKNIKAVVFGDLVKCEEVDGKDYVTPTIIDFFTQLKVPAFRGIQSGHGTIQRPVFFNTEAKISRSLIDQTHFEVVICSPYEIL